MINKIKYLGLLFILLSAIISCEKDFRDVQSAVIGNTKFETKQSILNVVVTDQPVARVRASGLTLPAKTLGQYWLGVYNNTAKTAYEKLEASLISQLFSSTLSSLKVAKTYEADTTVVTKMDKVFLTFPYQATNIKKIGDAKPKFRLDNLLGNANKGFSVKVYQNNTFLHNLDPADPTKTKAFYSDEVYEKVGGALNEDSNYLLKPNANDTVYYFDRHLSTGGIVKDSLKLVNTTPFAVIPLDKDKIKMLFLDKYGTADFKTRQAFDNYFRGLIVEATGTEGSLIPFNFSASTGGSNSANIRPSLEICYTNTILKAGKVVDTIKKQDSYIFSGVRNSIYKMTTVQAPATKDIIVQGTAGNEGEIKLFSDDELKSLRAKNWLITDASLTFYVDQDIVGYDTIATPRRLFLYKRGTNSKGKLIESQIKDALISNILFDGKLQLTDKKPDKYSFHITHYVADLLSGRTNYNPPLRLKVYNPTDKSINIRDTIVRNYNWNPRAVTLLNHLETNGKRKAVLKISYSVKK